MTDMTIRTAGMSLRQRMYATLLAEKHIRTKVKRHTYETPFGLMRVILGKTAIVEIVK